MQPKTYKELAYEYALEKNNDKLRKKGRLPLGEEPVYIAYLRKSTEEDSKQQTSLKAQYTSCLDYANINNLKVVGYIRESHSAFISGKRLEFSEILEEIKDVENRQFNSILAYSPDRLSRNMKEAGEIIDLLHNHTMVDLQLSSFEFTNDHNGQMNLGIHFVMAKLFSDILSAHTLKGLGTGIGEGKGIKDNKKGYVFDSKETKRYRPDGKNFRLIQEAFEMALNNLSYPQIAKHMNQKRFSYKGSKSKVTPKVLSTIFADPIYCGIISGGKEVFHLLDIDSEFQPAVSYEDFVKLRERLSLNRAYKRKYSETILFRGLVTCEHCGSTMTPGKPKGNIYRYLRLTCNNKSKCPRYHEEYINKKKKIKFRKDIAGREIFRYMDLVLKDGIKIKKETYEEHIKLIPERNRRELKSVNGEIGALQRDINEYTTQISNLTDLFTSAKKKTTQKEIEERIEILSTEKSELLERKEKLSTKTEKLRRRLEQELISWDKFQELFKYINGQINNQDNRFIADNAIRIVFQNFTVRNQKVVSHKITEVMEPYKKLKDIPNGVDEGI